MSQRTRSYRISWRFRRLTANGRGLVPVVFRQRVGTTRRIALRETGNQAMVADDVLRKEQIESPVEGDTGLLLKARQLHQVDCSPQPPRDESGEIDTQDIRHAGASADRRQLAEC